MRAAALHSQASADSRREALRAARADELTLLYVAPERFASQIFRPLLPEIAVAFFVSAKRAAGAKWGHAFGPDYQHLHAAAAGCLRSNGRAGRPPIAAFTAT